jgi:hypothetical protein
VCAEAAERQKYAFGGMQQETGMLGVWVGNDFHPANADIICARHHRNGIRIFPGANVNDQPAKSCGEAGRREIFCKLSARKSLVVRMVDKAAPVSRNSDWLRAEW